MKYAIIGSSGYIAPRHIKAIENTQGEIIAAFDINHNNNLPKQSIFFDNYDSFQNYIIKNKPNYLVVCSPNYLHFEHIKFGLENNVNVICEKPLVLNLQDFNKIVEIKKNASAKIYSIFQLRYHQAVKKLYNKITQQNLTNAKINLHYITPRDENYLKTWKGNSEKSGGILANIGIHFFDMLINLFGKVQDITISEKSFKTIKGKLILQRANVDWLLSIDKNNLPDNHDNKTYRSLTIDGEELDFSLGFDDLHTISYQEILANRGFGLEEVEPSLTLIEKIKTL